MARVSLKEGELGVALGNGRPLASIRVQILVKTTVNDKRQKARIPETKLQWLPARHAILTSGSGRTLNGRESLRAGRDAQLLPCRPAVRYPGPNAHTGPDGRTSVNQPSVVGRERDEGGGAAEAGVLMRGWRIFAWTGAVIDCAMIQIGPVLRIHWYSKFKPYNKEMRAREELALGHFM